MSICLFLHVAGAGWRPGIMSPGQLPGLKGSTSCYLHCKGKLKRQVVCCSGAVLVNLSLRNDVAGYCLMIFATSGGQFPGATRSR